MLGIREGFKRAFSDENAIVKHMLLFVLTGVGSMFAIPINDMSKNPNLTTSEWCFAMVSVLICFGLSFFVMGYIFDFVKRVYNGEDSLPEFDIKQTLKGLKFFPVFIVWFIYFGIICFPIAIITAFSKPVGAILFLLLGLFFALFLLVLPLFIVEYSKEFSLKGLFNPKTLFKYVRDALGHMLFLVLKLLPVLIVLFIVNTIGIADKTVFGYIMAALGGYLGCVVSLIANFCSVEIYKEVYEKN